MEVAAGRPSSTWTAASGRCWALAWEGAELQGSFQISWKPTQLSSAADFLPVGSERRPAGGPPSPRRCRLPETHSSGVIPVHPEVNISLEDDDDDDDYLDEEVSGPKPRPPGHAPLVH